MRDANHYGGIALPVTDEVGAVISVPMSERIPVERSAEWCPGVFWNAKVPFNPAAKVAGAELEAFINEGRLIVSCPDCGGAQLAALEDPRFCCVDCGNVDNGGAWRPVAFPAALPAIVEILEGRIDVADQSWTPGKSLEDLAVENVELDRVEAEVDVEVLPVEPPIDEEIK